MYQSGWLTSFWLCRRWLMYSILTKYCCVWLYLIDFFILDHSAWCKYTSLVHLSYIFNWVEILLALQDEWNVFFPFLFCVVYFSFQVDFDQVSEHSCKLCRRWLLSSQLFHEQQNIFCTSSMHLLIDPVFHFRFLILLWLSCCFDFLIGIDIVLMYASECQCSRKLLQQIELINLLGVNINNVLFKILNRARYVALLCCEALAQVNIDHFNRLLHSILVLLQVGL